MKKLITLILFMLFFISSIYPCWEQFQKNHKHTGEDCDITITTPLCIRKIIRVCFNYEAMPENALPLVDEEGNIYINHFKYISKINPKIGVVLWERTTTPTINTSGIIHNKKVIFTTTSNSLVAYDFNGNFLWEKIVNSSGQIYANLSFYIPNITPTLFNNKIYIGTSKGEIVIISADTGDTLKNYQIASGEIISAPAIDDDGTIYFGSRDNNFYSINGETGNIIWNINLGSPIYSSPSIDETGIYITNGFGEVFKLNKTNGNIIWKKSTGSWANGTGAIYGDSFFIGSDDRHVYKFNKYTGEIKWKVYVVDNIAKMSCIVVCAKLFVLGCIDKLIMIDTETGYKEFVCNTVLPNFRNITYSNGELYFTSQDNFLYVVGPCQNTCSPCTCDAKKFPTPVFKTPTRTFTPTKYVNPTITWTITPTQTITPTNTITFTQSNTFTNTLTLTPTSTPTLFFTDTFTPTATLTNTPMPCNGIATPVFNVKMIFNPENTDNIIFEIKSSVPLLAPPLATVYPHGSTCQKSILTFTAEEIPNLENTYRVLYPKQTGFGDIDKIIIKGKDICGVEGQSDGSFTKSVISQLDVKLFNNVIKPVANERCTIHYKIYNNDKIMIKIFNRAGNLVKTLYEGFMKAGEYECFWDGKDVAGKPVADGIYIIVVSTSYYEIKDKTLKTI